MALDVRILPLVEMRTGAGGALVSWEVDPGRGRVRPGQVEEGMGSAPLFELIRRFRRRFRRQHKREPTPFDLAANLRNASDGDAMAAMVAFMEDRGASAWTEGHRGIEPGAGEGG
jgi:hypothetical protein